MCAYSTAVLTLSGPCPLDGDFESSIAGWEQVTLHTDLQDLLEQSIDDIKLPSFKLP